MKIDCEAVGENQIYPAEKKRVKEVFDGYEIEILFWKGNNSFVQHCKTLPEMERKPEIVNLQLRDSPEECKNEYILWIKSFHKKYYSENLKTQFSEEVLPDLFERYLFHTKKIEEGTERIYNFTVCMRTANLSLRKKRRHRKNMPGTFLQGVFA